ncbi:MAG TPA: DUF5317 family protein [Acidimicrobiales bacterium]|nr:DUF5317 family protein [Acidimicrobiales bacterium]
MPVTRDAVWPGPFRWPLALGAGAMCELVSSLWVGGAAGLALLIAGYALLICFAARNLAIAGAVLVIVGLVANLTVMAVDGGMPVRGLPPASGFGPRHHGQGPADHLTALGDVVAVPALGEVFSAGDLLLAAGVATMLVSVNPTGWRRRRRAAASS